MIIKRRHPNSFIASLAYKKSILHKNTVTNKCGLQKMVQICNMSIIANTYKF